MKSREQTIRRAMRQSHELQFGGMDYQAAMWEVGQDINPPLTHDEIIEIESAPDPYCNCGFCASADWPKDEMFFDVEETQTKPEKGQAK